MYRLGFNPTSGPVVIDAEGRTLGGGEWGPVDSTANAVRAAVDAGALVLQDAPAEDAQTAPAASTAAAAVVEAEDRRARLGDLDREVLGELARNTGVIDAGEDTPTKAELVAMLTPRTNVAIPAPPAPARGRKSQEG